MLIGILQTGGAPEALKDQSGDYPDMFQRLLAGQGLTFRTWRVEAMEFPKDVHEAEGWLITGSRHGVYEDHPFIKPLEEFVRQAFAENVPVVGICFGHQLIAQAMGGTVERFDKGWAVGPTAYRFGDEELTLNAWHRDQVTKAPAGAKVLAGNEFCENAALLYQGKALTVQAHPEFADPFVQGLMETRGKGLVPDDLMAAASAKLGQPKDEHKIAARIAAFFKNPKGLS